MSATRGRDRSIDAMKGLLVFGMVYAHVLQFFSPMGLYPVSQAVSDVVNLITFSGFVFCFGYTNQLAYYSKPFGRAYRNMLLSALKTLVAFYISGAAFRVFIGGAFPDGETLRPILLLEDIPGWSEFLVSFSLISLIGVALFPALRRLAERPALLWTVCALLLLATYIPYESVRSTQLGLLIGTTAFPSFPVLQYFPYYLAGMAFAKGGVRWGWPYAIGAAAASGTFAYVWAAGGYALPSRFPPSAAWILGPALLLYGYYLLSSYGVRALARVPGLLTAGRNVLFYLLASNLAIFAAKSRVGEYPVSPGEGLALTALLLAGIAFATRIVAPPERAERPTSRPADASERAGPPGPFGAAR